MPPDQWIRAQAAINSVVRSCPAHTYLIQTDPRFTNLRQWLSSDYMLTSLGSDPASITKRLGDGFYEQRLINEQVGQLTGRRFLSNFTSAQQQYQSLMDSGITVARAFNLQPGIALSAAQMAQLTSDIVWLVEQSVTLPDGTSTRALVPQLYIAKLQPGDLSGAGALLSGREVNIRMTGDVTNSGTIAGRTALNLAANNLQNIGGILSADSTSITAAQDIHNTGGRIAAQNALALTAGRDINILSTSQSSATQIGASSFSRTSIDRIAGLYVTNPDGTLVASAGRDVNITAGVVKNSAQTGQAGQTTINAAGNINLATLTTAESANSVRDARNFVRFSQSQEVGSQITTEGSLSLSAGANINARAASIQSQQSTQLIAAGSVNLTEGVSTRSLQEAQFASTKGFMSSRSRTSRTTEDSTQSVGTNVGGNTVNVTANKDINIKGSSVIADKDATLKAGNTVNIEAASNTASNTSFVETKESGFLSGGGFGITYGKREQSLEQKSQSTTAAASTVGAIGGNININAGQAYKQVGSDLIAPTGDINITAKKVDIVEARETSQTTTEQKFKQTALTLSVSSPVISAIQSAQGMAQAASQTSSGRMQALAAASTALNVYNNAKDIGDAATALGKGDLKNAASINVSIGTSKSQSNSSSQSDTARGSSIAAGSNVNITATGADKSAGQQSDILIQGSSVKAANTTTLTADNQVNLLAAKNTSSQTSTNSNSASSIGASFSAQGISANASVSRGSGRSDGQDTTFTNTNVSAGNTAIINSGGDTTVIGATVEANQIKANIGGSLKAESLQDTSTFTSSQRSANASISVPITGGSFGASVGASKSNVDSNFQSVGQMSGLKAGDGGFQVDIKNNTTLTGAVIASTQGAVDNNKNTFTTGGSLTITDIQNTASFKGTASGVSVGVGSELSKSGAGVGSTGGNASSTSTAGISGIAGNTAVRTGDAETGLKPIFDAEKVQKDIDAQVKIMTAFTQQAGKAVGDYAGKQMQEAIAKKEQAKDEKAPTMQAALLKEAEDIESTWGEGKPGRVWMHAIIGALTGNLAGALGAGASQAVIPYIGDAIAQLDVPLEVKQALIQVAGGAVGAAVGGASGGTSALTITANNYLTHIQWELLSKKLKSCKTQAECAQATKDAVALSAKQDAELRQSCQDTGSAACRSQLDAALDGSRTQMELIAAGKLPDNYAAGADLNAQANRLARNVIVSDIKAACLADNACKQKQDNINGALMLGTIGLITAPMLPSLGSAAVAWIVANPVTAMQLGIISAETAAALATGAVSPSSLAEGMFAVAAMGSIKFVGAAGGGKGFVGGTTIKTLAEAADTVTAQSAAQAQRLQQELQTFSKVQPDTAKDAFYLANTDQSLLTANKFDMNHVLSGEINPAGRATGYHAELAAEGSARIRPGSSVTQNANGTYTAQVDVFDAAKGVWVEKKGSGGGISTFFNPTWSAARIEYEVAQAFKDKKMIGPTKWEGTTPSGIRIEGYTNPSRTTFYPTGQ